MKNPIAKYRLLAFVICVFLYVCCDKEERDDFYDYLAPSYIDTVLVGDSVAIGESVPVVHVFPYGCNSFERIGCSSLADTLLLSVIYRFKFEGKPCAHGTGLDTTRYVLCFGDTGSYTVKYRRDNTTTVYQSVFAK